MHKTPLLPFLLILLLLACLHWTSEILPGSAFETNTQRCLVCFAESFSVDMGITLPLAGGASGPVAQSGTLLVDSATHRVRVNHFYQGRQHTVLLDGGSRWVYVVETDPADGGTRCTKWRTAGSVPHPSFCVPVSATADAEQMFLVRGVPVRRWSALDRQDGPLAQVDYFVFNHSGNAVPWRTQIRLRPGAERREISGEAFSTPNWRFFGGPMYDEVAIRDETEPRSDSLQPYVSELEVLTVDFFNYLAAAPDPSLFAVPATCVEQPDSVDEDPTETSKQVSVLQSLPGVEHLLIGGRFL